MTKQFDDLKLLGERNRLIYLESVNWYAIRKITHNTSIPAEVLTKMALARTEISEIRAAVTYNDISHLTITFS